MTKTESLTKLARWAFTLRRFGVGQSPAGNLLLICHADDAKRHGLAAVHAFHVVAKAKTAPLVIVSPFIAKTRNESRLAFRAALSAVGIKGAL